MTPKKIKLKKIILIKKNKPLILDISEQKIFKESKPIKLTKLEDFNVKIPLINEIVIKKPIIP